MSTGAVIGGRAAKVYPTPGKHLKAAMDAKCDLNIFAAIVAILEGGTVSNGDAASRSIIKICHAEQQRQLKIMDRAVAAVNAESAGGAK